MLQIGGRTNGRVGRLEKGRLEGYTFRQILE